MKINFASHRGLLMAALSFLVLAGNLSARDFYVDYSAGLDSGDGSTSHPWKHCPGDVAASGNVTNTTLSAGDTVHFKKGVSYVLDAAPGIVVAWSGNPGQPITYEGGTWGTATNPANIRAPYTNGVQVGSGYRAFINNIPGLFRGININSFDIGPIGGSLTVPADTGSAVPAVPGYGILAYQAVLDNVVISNCFFHELGYYYNVKPMGYYSIGGVGIQFGNGFVNATITNCQFRNMSIAVEAVLNSGVALSNLDIGGCEFSTNIVWGVDLAIATGAVFDGIQVHGNSFHNMGDGYAHWSGYGSPPHVDCIFYRGDSATSWTSGTNINFYNNLFYYGWYGTGSILSDTGGNMNVYNNLFYYGTGDNGQITMDQSTRNADHPTTYRIYNNTFVASGTLIFLRGPWYTNSTVDIKNNLFYVTAAQNGFALKKQSFDAAADAAFTNLIQCDYDGFYGPNPNYFAFADTGYDTGWTLATTQGAYGWEKHGLSTYPQFVNSAIPALTGFDLHLANPSNSVAIGGANLSNLKFPGFQMDKDGNPRPPSAPWSMGAYQATTSQWYNYYYIQTNLVVTNLIADNKYTTNFVTQDVYLTNQVVDNHYVTNLINLSKATTNVLVGDVFVTNRVSSTLSVTNQVSRDIYATNQYSSAQVVTNLLYTNVVTANIYATVRSATTNYVTNLFASVIYSTNTFPATVYTTNLYLTNLFTGTTQTNSPQGGPTNGVTGNVSSPTNSPTAPPTVNVVTTITTTP